MTPPRTLFDLLACPACRAGLVRADDTLTCSGCETAYPIVDGVPVFLPGMVPEFEKDLPPRPGYSAWKERLLIKTLQPGQVALDFGCGYQEFDHPNVVRMDASLHPYVDVVGDVHALPFKDDVLHAAFGGAVFEHLERPRQAAAELWRCLAPGGYLYADWNFVFAYHGYPAHYFNASVDAVRSVFGQFVLLEIGVAPFQGPGAALRQVIGTYLETFAPTDEDSRRVRDTLAFLLLHPLEQYDRHIPPADRHRTAAGIYIVGLKERAPGDSILPESLLAAWAADPALQARYPEPRHVTADGGLLRWAEGRPPLVEGTPVRFRKDGQERPAPPAMAAWDWEVMTEPHPSGEAALLRMLVRRQRPLGRKLIDALRSPADLVRLPIKVVRYVQWRLLHRAGRAV
jgi:uncharacterized protein YbaR (Trm112 family)